MKTIVALVDFSDVTPKILEQAENLAKTFAAHIVLMHVVPNEAMVVGFDSAPAELLQGPTEKEVQADYANLLALRDSLTSSGVNATAHQLRMGSVDKLLEESERLNADLIVLGSHHHGALYDWFVGTFTTEALRRTHCPVLVVPTDVLAS